MVQYPEEFTTTDLNLAAYLTTLGKFRIVSTRRIDDFTPTVSLKPRPTRGDISDYYIGKAKISAIKLCEALREIRDFVWCGQSPTDELHPPPEF